MAREPRCECVVKNREKNESQRDWMKRFMCQYHWMQTDYYQRKLEERERVWNVKDE